LHPGVSAARRRSCDAEREKTTRFAPVETTIEPVFGQIKFNRRIDRF
jgi:hypothetical protein